MTDNDPLMVKSVEKAIRLLNAFGDGQPTMSLAEVAAATKMDKSAAQRFTHTLVQLGYLHKSPDTKRFELTPRVLELGAHYARTNSLIRATAPYLLKLSQSTEESVSLSVLDGVDIVYIQRLVSRNMLANGVITGTRLPAYCTAPGLALLSGLPRPEAVALLERSDRKAYTPQTIWQMPDLLRELDKAVAQGFVLIVEQIFYNDISVAVPIYGPDRRAVGAVSIGVNKLRCSAEDARERFAPLLIAVSDALSPARPSRLETV